MFTSHSRSLSRVLRCRRRADALVRRIEDLNLKLHEDPPRRLLARAKLDALRAEVGRLELAVQRAAEALSRAKCASARWINEATPPDERPQPQAAYSYPPGQQPESPYPPAASPVPTEAEVKAARLRRLREKLEQGGNEPGERRVRLGEDEPEPTRPG